MDDPATKTKTQQAELFTGLKSVKFPSFTGLDGRDELNLAEFPLASLSHRTPEGQSTLEFRDRVFDKSTGQWVDRKLTILAPEKFGLPNAMDDEIILGLIQLSKRQGFTSRTVPFSRYEILKILGWGGQGWFYDRILQALDRWTAVTLKYENAWWDAESKAWVNETFHIIDRVTEVKEENGKERVAFVWSEVIFNSLQKGHLKPLDLDIYRSLKNPVAKRLYRLLDKRFYLRRRVKFNLVELAYHKMGISKTYLIGNIKQRLQPAIKELENIGFIKKAGKDERYVKLGVGEWTIIFEKADGAAGSTTTSQKDVAIPAPAEEALSEIEAVLVEIGVSPKKACSLATTMPEDYLRHKVDALHHVISSGKKIDNPAGYLVSSIEENFAPPKDYKTPEERERIAAQRKERQEAKALKDKASEEKKRQKELEEGRSAAERKRRVAAYLESLTDEERELVISEAILREKAKGDLILSRADSPFFAQSREAAIEAYIIEILVMLI